MPNFLEQSSSELTTLLASWDEPVFRIGQIRRWVFSRKMFEFAAMSDLSKQLRERLTTMFGTSVFAGKVTVHTKSEDVTEKLLVEWNDGNCIECVLLRDDRNHRTACVSTQVGCAMGCRFCASGLDGFVRNLSRGEIMEQILRLNALLPASERLTHLVVMGTGEPLLNLDNLTNALVETVSTDGLDLGGRKVTISTVGIPSGIKKLADLGCQYKLAISLHAPNDNLRSEIVPQNKVNSIAPIMAAADEYFEKVGRRVTFEYVLIKNLNDRPEHARELAKLLRGRTAVVNLIPFNPVTELKYKTPNAETIRNFTETLKANNIQVKVRYKKGDKINAACGQLRRMNKVLETQT
ncbi:MAG: 23S rRNA (adenine(2503)-C(2))-methyltransferase RlmN [Planctomycetaceae bacterium]|nr:23S rRNA (adenine(2503)-C(2))-methyltransferase RlmN [Planctomycetaceae bacterium]